MTAADFLEFQVDFDRHTLAYQGEPIPVARVFGCIEQHEYTVSVGPHKGARFDCPEALSAYLPLENGAVVHLWVEPDGRTSLSLEADWRPDGTPMPNVDGVPHHSDLEYAGTLRPLAYDTRRKELYVPGDCRGTLCAGCSHRGVEQEVTSDTVETIRKFIEAWSRVPIRDLQAVQATARELHVEADRQEAEFRARWAAQ